MSIMEIKKARWTTDGDNFSINMPLSKVDTEKRLVSGWASLDNVDLQGDLVLAEASEKAFKRFRGNIREMHQPIAAGRMVSYRPDQYYDAETKKFYNGIYVTAYISKGAQATWEKVLDGTLQAFSIKGPIRDSEMEFSKSEGRPVRIVKDYDLEELSLVDSPGNQHANIVSFEKSVDGQMIAKGMITETKSENVFYCSRHDSPIAKTSNETDVTCFDGHKMENIGWFEYGTDEEKAEKVSGIVEKYNSSNTDSAKENAKQELPAQNEGGVDVAEENKNTTDVVEGSAATEEVAPSEQGAAANEVVADKDSDVKPVVEEEKAADVSEVQVEDTDFEKMFTDLSENLKKGFDSIKSEVDKKFEEVSKSFEAKFAELEKSHGELTEKFTQVQAKLTDVEKSVGGLQEESAIKKSGDLGGSTGETLEKRNVSKGSVWNGTFLGVRHIAQDEE